MSMIVTTEKLKEVRNRGESNLHYKLLKEQGIDITIDRAFLHDRFLLRTDRGKHLGGVRDSKMSLVTENPSLRKGLAITLTECINTGRNWAQITVDLDQLKKANTDVGRLFGDAYLRWGAVQVVNILKQNDQGESLLGKTVLYKEGTTSDEVKLWFFGVSDEELKEIEKLNRRVNKRTQQVRVTGNKNQELKFNFGLSSGLVTSKDREVSKLIDEARSSSTQPVFWDIFNLINNLSDLESDRHKLAKDLGNFQSKITEACAYKDITRLNKWLIDEYGDGRIKSEVLELILEITELAIVDYIAGISIETLNLLKTLNLNKEDLQGISTIKGLRVIFNKIFNHQKNKIIS